ncbi:MAG: hypothetical protein WCB85_00970, partial [Candidatus Dormiibacterota bacterium]
MHWLKSSVAAYRGRGSRDHPPRHGTLLMGAGIAVLLASGLMGPSAVQLSSTAAGINPVGELDCNGYSPVQHPLRAMSCTDIRGFAGVDNANTWGGRFYDNGVYIGHDEPDATFLSNAPGSGNDVTWNETLGADPAAAPTTTSPGSDVTHWFELTPAPWLSMAICDPNSYPQLPCQPKSDGNAPQCTAAFNCPYNDYPGAGGAFMEMQFYPPGNMPWVDNESCSGTQWCAALTIDSLECTYLYAQCNTNCEEPVNFAFIQTNGVPTGPPSPQDSDLASDIPNGHTLLMNSSDKVTVHMFDAPVPGGGGAKALKVTIDDLTTGQSGFMQASAKNGFMNTSIVNCSGTPFNFEPEYNTAAARNIIPWAALQTNISTEFETGHFEPCTSLSDPISNPYSFVTPDESQVYNECNGPYETAGGAEGAETGDALCWEAGDTHPNYDGKGGTTAPDLVTGCQDNIFQNGDLDFDGTSYYADWPTSTSPGTFPGSFVESTPTTGGGRQYSQFLFQTDIGLSEYIDPGGAGCTNDCKVPPPGPGNFYPYWSTTSTRGHGPGADTGGPGPGPGGPPGSCSLLFGNVSGHGVNTFGKDAEYGSDLYSTLG